MPSPSQDIYEFARRLRDGGAQPLAPDEQAGAGAAVALGRNGPTAGVMPYPGMSKPYRVASPGLPPGATIVNGGIRNPNDGTPNPAPRSKFSMGPFQKEPAAPTGAAPTAPTANLLDRVKGMLRTGGTAVAEAPKGLAAGAMSAAQNPTVLGAGGTAIAAVPGALRTGDVLANPKATWGDVANQGLGELARVGGAFVGGLGGGTAGTAVAGPIGTGVGAVGGGAYGYYAADKTVRGIRGLLGMDPRDPAEILGAPAKPMRMQSLTGEAPTIPVARPTPTTPAPDALRPTFSDARFEAQAGRDPSRPYDFTKDLANVPKDLPASLPDGKIYKTKGLNGETVYSGRNVKDGADIVNGSGGALPERGSFTSLPSEGHAANLRTLAILQAQNAAAAVPTGGVTDMGGSKGTTMMDDLVAKGRAGADLRGMSPRAQAHYLTQQAALDKQSQIAQMQNATALRGQDVGAATSRYGTDVGAATSRYGADRALEGHTIPMQQQLRTMQMHQMISQLAGNDPIKAAQLKASMGLDPTHDLAVFGAIQKRDGETTNAINDAFKDQFKVGAKADGTPIFDTGAQTRAANFAHMATGGNFYKMSKPEQAQIVQLALAQHNAAQAYADSRQNKTLGVAMGMATPDPRTDILPNFGQGTTIRRGRLYNNLPGTGEGKNNDYIFTHNGREYPIPENAMPEPLVTHYIKQGATWEK